MWTLVCMQLDLVMTSLEIDCRKSSKGSCSSKGLLDIRQDACHWVGSDHVGICLQEKLETVMQLRGADGHLKGQMPASAFAGLHHPGTITKACTTGTHYAHSCTRALCRTSKHLQGLKAPIKITLKCLTIATPSGICHQSETATVRQTRWMFLWY